MNLTLPQWLRGIFVSQPSKPMRQIRLRNTKQKFASNKISTTKYNPLTFLPKFLFEQFQLFFNLFFLSLSVLQQIKGVSPTGRYTTAVPLGIVWCCSAVKEIIEDIKRWHADKAINHKEVHTLNGDTWALRYWQHIKVGDIVMIKKNNFFPADLLLLSSSEQEAMAYVETSNLDGETNLKFRLGHPQTEYLRTEGDLSLVEAVLEYENPNPHMYEFNGKITFDDGRFANLGPEQLLLRGAKLKNTDRVYAVVIYTGRESKMMFNTGKPRLKRSNVQRTMNQQILCIVGILLALSLLSALLSQAQITLLEYDPTQTHDHWYLEQLEKTSPLVTFILNLFTFIILYNILVPISLVITLEFVRLTQALFLYWDVDMYHEPTDTAAAAKTSGLNEELGQIKYLLTDKTGTLTENVMVFKMCSIGDQIYGSSDPGQFSDTKLLDALADPVKCSLINDFLLSLAVCHTVIPEPSETEDLNYHASSPDELALIRAAAKLGFKFCARTPTSMSVAINGTRRIYELLNVIEFTSYRKRMSVIVKCPDGVIRLFCKGSDSTILPRLRADDQYKNITDKNLIEFAESGYRTLCFAKAEVDKSFYDRWSEEYAQALRSPDTVESVAEKIEKDMILIGASAIEDKLQEGVPETIEALLEADIKVWMLTGDKQETAVNIGRSCSLIRSGMELLIVQRNSYGDTHDCINKYINDVGSKLETENNLALIIDGTSLKFALLGEACRSLAQLALSCRVVICCRVSPQQKAAVVTLIRRSLGHNATTMAIGDGGNDVPMIQAAHVGVGIYGQEGLQAACASDYSIAQFRFLQKLLFVHGAWNFHRIIKLIVYSYYKNAVIVFTFFYYCFYCAWSGSPFVERWIIANYNIIFVSLAPLAIGLFDRTATAQTMLKYPALYKLSQDRQAFSIGSFLIWHFFAAVHSLVIFFFVVGCAEGGFIWPNGRTAGQYQLSTIVCGYIIVIVNLKAGLEIETWSWPVHVCVWGSILSFVLYVSVVSYVWPVLPFSQEMAGQIELLSVFPSFWFGLLLIPVSALFVDVVLKVIRRTFFKTTADIVREIENQQYDLSVVLSQKLSSWKRGVELKLRQSPSLTLNDQVHHGFAFSQDEEGTMSQSDLVRLDRHKEDSCTAVVSKTATNRFKEQSTSVTPSVTNS